MKKLQSGSIIVIVLLAFLSGSCKKEKSLDELVIGKWEVQSIKQVNYENDIKKSETTFFAIPDELSIQFVDGGTGIQFENGEMVGAFTWTLSNSTLSVILGMQIYSWKITIDNDTLIWSFSESEEDSGVTYKYEYFYTAVRVG